MDVRQKQIRLGQAFNLALSNHVAKNKAVTPDNKKEYLGDVAMFYDMMTEMDKLIVS